MPKPPHLRDPYVVNIKAHLIFPADCDLDKAPALRKQMAFYASQPFEERRLHLHFQLWKPTVTSEEAVEFLARVFQDLVLIERIHPTRIYKRIKCYPHGQPLAKQICSVIHELIKESFNLLDDYSSRYARVRWLDPDDPPRKRRRRHYFEFLPTAPTQLAAGQEPLTPQAWYELVTSRPKYGYAPDIIEHYFKRSRRAWPKPSRLTYANDFDNPLPNERLDMHQDPDPDAPYMPHHHRFNRRFYLNRGLPVPKDLNRPPMPPPLLKRIYKARSADTTAVWAAHINSKLLPNEPLKPDC